MTDQEKKLDEVCEAMYYYVIDLAGHAGTLEEAGYSWLGDDMRKIAGEIENLALRMCNVKQGLPDPKQRHRYSFELVGYSQTTGSTIIQPVRKRITTKDIDAYLRKLTARYDRSGITVQIWGLTRLDA